jgi:pyruvate dehydrogenase (quinone)
MAKATVADLLVERLIAWGVDTIFGFPGDGVNGIFEALRTHEEKLKFIQVRHEEAAAFAACGYAKYTGRLGVCSTVCMTPNVTVSLSWQSLVIRSMI